MLCCDLVAKMRVFAKGGVSAEKSLHLKSEFRITDGRIVRKSVRSQTRPSARFGGKAECEEQARFGKKML